MRHSSGHKAEDDIPAFRREVKTTGSGLFSRQRGKRSQTESDRRSRQHVSTADWNPSPAWTRA